MALEFGFGPIDYADCTFQASGFQFVANRLSRRVSKMQHESLDFGVVTDPFIAGIVRRPYPLDLHRSVPVRGGRNGSMVGTEANQECRLGESCAR